MTSRAGMRAGGVLAAIACAILAACGGGSGSGSGTIPVSNPTATPTNTPTPSSGTVALSANAPTTITFATTGSLTGGSITMPAVNYDGATGTFSASATLPPRVPAPAARSIRFTRLHPQNIGVTYTALTYISATFNESLSIASTPAIVANYSSALSGQLYLVEFDPGQPNAGWNAIAGPISANGSSVTFPAASGAVPYPLVGGSQPYVYAIITTGSAIPTPAAAPTAPPTPSAVGPDATLPPVDTVTGGVGFTAHQVAATLQFPVQSGYNGKGQTIVIVGDATPDPADVSTYLTTLNINRTGSYSVVPIAASAPPGDASDTPEATLDVETVEGLAPGANVEFYYLADATAQSFVAAEQQVLSDTNHPSVMSISFGGCEYDQNKSVDDPLFAQGIGEGIAYVASAGDSGNECPGLINYQPGVNNPASDPNVIGVGGTENLNANCGVGVLTSQDVWNDSCLGGQGAGGGGISTLFTTLPSYQNGISGVTSSARNVPDVSMPAEGTDIFLAGQWQEFGGTSWGAPQLAAMFAELDEYCGGAPSNPVAEFYKAYTANAHDFVDVLYGNDQFAAATPVYGAASGYDNATGLGVPYGMALAHTLCPSRTWNSRAAHPMSIARTDAYGEARATSVGYMPNVRQLRDLGQRHSSETTPITITLRATPTLESDEQAVIASLKHAGFSIAQTWPTHLAIRASAPASVVESYFSTAIHDVDQGHHGARFANTAPAILPASIAPYVRGVILDNLVTRKPI